MLNNSSSRRFACILGCNVLMKDIMFPFARSRSRKTLLFEMNNENDSRTIKTRKVNVLYTILN